VFGIGSDGLGGTCPSPCVEFSLLFMGNPCSATLLSAVGVENVTKVAALEATVVAISGSVCDSDCLQETLPALKDLVPACSAALFDVASSSDLPYGTFVTSAIATTEGDACDALKDLVTNSSCVALNAAITRGYELVAEGVFDAPIENVSVPCLQWTVGLPRSLWSCFVAATLFYELGESCPTECSDALAFVSDSACSEEELALLPPSTISTAKRVYEVATSVCSDECLLSLPAVITVASDCLESALSGSVIDAAVAFLSEPSCAALSDAALDRPCSSKPHPISSYLGVSTSCHAWALEAARASYACVVALGDYVLGDECPQACLDYSAPDYGALNLLTASECDNAADSAVLISLLGPGVVPLNEQAQHMFTKAMALCESDCLEDDLPQIVALADGCSQAASDFAEANATTKVAMLLALRDTSADEATTGETAAVAAVEALATYEPFSNGGGTCMQLLAGLDSSSCFTRRDTGGLLAPAQAEQLARSLNVSETCIAWAAELEEVSLKCDADRAAGATSCPASCAATLKTAAQAPANCELRDLAKLPPSAVDLPFEALAALGDECDGTCLETELEEVTAAAAACLSDIDALNGTDICPAACVDLLGVIAQSSCLPASLTAAAPPEWLGLLQTACTLKNTCLEEAEVATPVVEECFDQLAALPQGLGYCVPECTDAVRLGQASECLVDLTDIAMIIRERDERHDSAYTNSRSISNNAKLARALTTTAVLNALGSVPYTAQGMCSDECLQLVDELAADCEEDLLAGTCSAECYTAQTEAMGGCLEDDRVDGMPAYAHTWNVLGELSQICEHGPLPQQERLLVPQAPPPSPPPVYSPPPQTPRPPFAPPGAPAPLPPAGPSPPRAPLPPSMPPMAPPFEPPEIPPFTPPLLPPAGPPPSLPPSPNPPKIQQLGKLLALVQQLRRSSPPPPPPPQPPPMTPPPPPPPPAPPALPTSCTVPCVASGDTCLSLQRFIGCDEMLLLGCSCSGCGVC